MQNRSEKSKAAPNAVVAPKDEELQYVFFADEPVDVDLVFSSEVRLHGLVTDDLGTPLKNALIQAGLVNSPRDLPGTPPGMWIANYLEDSPRGIDGSFNGFFALPEEFRQTRTDADGRYELRGLPRDCALIAYLDYLPEYEPKVENLKTGKTRLDGGGFLIFSGELNHTFVAPSTIQVKISGPAFQPLANVVVRGQFGQGVQRAGSMGRTDAGGSATLKLRPGKVVLNVEPVIGQPFLPRQIEMEVKDEPREVSIDVNLEPAAEVVFEAIEKESGKPIAGIAFLSEPNELHERTPVQSQLSFVDHPRSDDMGQFRAFFEPGERLFFVDRLRSSSEFEALEPGTQPIDLVAGTPTHVRFEFTRRSQTPPDREEAEPISEELKPLADLLETQRQRFEGIRHMRFSLRHNNYLTAPLTREQVTQLLDSFASMSVDECLEALRREFPDFNGFGTFELVTDGTRRRVEFRYPGQDRTEVNLFNGEELLQSMGSGTQLDVYGRDNSIIHFLNVGDFWNGPSSPNTLKLPKPAANENQPRQTTRHLDGAWEIVRTSGETAMRHVIDDATGFQRVTAYTRGQQYGPGDSTVLSDVAAQWDCSAEAVDSCVLSRPGIRSVLKSRSSTRWRYWKVCPPETFILEVPPGTNVIDYRGIPRNEMGQGRQPRMGVVRTSVPDVIAYCTIGGSPLTEPVLKVGDPAPKLDVLSWFGADGQAVTPELTDKIILIDFWGISCGPCVVQLAEVNTAAKHFADSKIAILGLHAGGHDPKKVVEFVKKRDLIFPIAIDNRDPTGRTFGATFAAFGVSGIPASVVIDATGQVAYIGHFQQAIEVARQLAELNAGR